MSDLLIHNTWVRGAASGQRRKMAWRWLDVIVKIDPRLASFNEYKVLKDKKLKLPKKGRELWLKTLEEHHIFIQKQLAKNIYNENLINALLNNYKLRLEVLEKLQKIIHFKNKLKDNSYEKNNKI